MSYTTPRQTVVFDSECYRNYWSIAFRDEATGSIRRFERTPEQELDIRGVQSFIRQCRWVGFNSNNYDLPMLALALTGASCAKLKEASDKIILTDLRSWQFLDIYNLRLPRMDHIDLMEVSPGSPQKPSLKMYAGRMHSLTMRDLPFDPDRTLSPEDIDVLRSYHVNDLIVTSEMLAELQPALDLRAQISDMYGIDLRSKSDAQMAEAIIKFEVERTTRRKVAKPVVQAKVFRYNMPSWARFDSQQMQHIADLVRSTKFVVGYDGVVRMPQELSDMKVQIGNSTYRMGIGGLHSSESCVTHYADDKYEIRDSDCTSYYPNIILTTGLAPESLGNAFTHIYRGILDSRVAAKKRAGELKEQIAELEKSGGSAELNRLKGEWINAETEAGAKKLSANGTYGKLGSPYSFLYAPDLMIQTTITGQLALLMLIERLEFWGFSVISANTDGIVTKIQREAAHIYDFVCKEWEADTGFTLEYTHYKAVHSRDVNSYVAISTNGKVKLKGAFSPAGPGQSNAAGLKKNPQCEIAIEAAVAFLKAGTPVLDTILSCRDVRKFVAVRRVNGGALKDGELVGKVIRFYYAEGETGCLSYATNGNTVPKTEGAKPLMVLPDELPTDIDYAWYEREATAILQDVGLDVIDPALNGRSGTMTATLPGKKTVHIVDLPNGVARCGRKPSGLRETWQEVDSEKLCKKCCTAI